MRNIFLLYMPPNNPEAMLHYRETIQQPVLLERVVRFLSKEQGARLRAIFGGKAAAVWGSQDSPANRAKFEQMAVGDDVLIVEGQTIRLLGKIALKLVSADLSRELWRNLNPQDSVPWSLIYFIANPLEIDVPFAEFCRLFGYAERYQLRGLTTVADERLTAFYDRYDELYSVLVRIKQGLPVMEKAATERPDAYRPAVEDGRAEAADPEAPPSEQVVSDHLRMQWKLLNLGLKAGDKVWIPAGDQGRIQREYEFSEFEREFVSGIDVPRTYVENIDVVWKDEFRIDAAFEIENSTAIYSGLLRFADLTTIAPNTTYPLFIVAPAARRNRVRDQVLRPSFRRLSLSTKVRFLPYEEVEEIERFFERSSGGLTAAAVTARSEEVK